MCVEDRLIGGGVSRWRRGCGCTCGDLATTNVCHSSQTFSAGDHDRHRPGQRQHPPRRDELAHLAAIAGEQHQREHRERQLQAEDDLAEDQQRAGAPLAVEAPR